MKACSILLVLFSTLIGWMSVHLFLYLLRKKIIPAKQADIKQMLVQKIQGLEIEKGMLEKFNQFDIAKEVSPLIEHRLQNLVDQLKHEIPMGEILLSGPLAERLKGRARDEIMKGLPEIKDQIRDKLEKEFAFEEQLEGVIGQFDIVQFYSSLQKEMKGSMTLLKGMGALVGFSLGILEMLLLLWIC
jgi:hypothetical protein